MTKVVVLGGGMGGLSAAFELITRGFEVEVYEGLDIFGGKARSFGVPNSGTGGRPDLPAEHGFRIFPSWYRHINDSMSRTPYTGPGATAGMTVDKRLVEVPVLAYAQNGKDLFEFPISQPDTLQEWIIALHAVFTAPELGVPRHDAEFFIRQLVGFMGSSEARRQQFFENIGWWQYLEAAQRSPQYQRICAIGMTRSLVAMQPEIASSYTVALIITQMLYTILRGDETNRILDGPTSSVWIDSWVAHLQSLGVAMHPSANVKGLNVSAGHIQSADIDVNGSPQTITADYFVCALPVEVARDLLTPAQTQQAGLQSLAQLQVSWMNGVMYYINPADMMAEGHIIYVDAPWAITAISQGQFWAPEFKLDNFGDGSARDIISAIISDWDKAGDQVFNQPAKSAPDAATIMNEVWAEMAAGRAAVPNGVLNAASVKARFLDPAIMDIESAATIQNRERLLINTVGSIADRPAATTAIPNLMLAGDYVNTHTNLATMEGANEAGRRAANAILDAEGAPANDRAGVWKLREPGFLDLWKQLDEAAFPLGLDPPIVQVVDALFEVFSLIDVDTGGETSRRALDTLRKRKDKYVPMS